jgi:peptidyl-prolyl cis-trans isomerase D
MLNNFRSFSGSIAVKLLLVLLILSFALWGVGDMVRQTAKGGDIASVGNEDISFDQYTRTLRLEMESIRGMFGNQYSPELMASLQLPEKILQQMVQQKLLKIEGQSVGIIPSDEQILKTLAKNPLFQDETGKFSKMRFEQVLDRSRKTEKNYIEALRGDIAAEQLSALFKAPLPRQEAAVRTLYLSQNARRTAKLYTLPPSAAKAPAAPTDAQLEGYYKEHAAEYAVPEYRTLSYLTISAKDAPKGDESAEGDAYTQYINAVEDALAGGSTLAEVAKEFGLTLKQAGTVNREGKAAEGATASLPAYDKFLDVAFQTEEGRESQLVSLKGGDLFVVRVDKLIPERQRTLAEVKNEVTQSWKADEAVKQLHILAQDIAKDFKNPKARGELTAKYGLRVRDSGAIKRSEDYDHIPPLLVDDIFKRPVGESTGVYPTGNGFTLAVVESLLPANLAKTGSEEYYKATNSLHRSLTRSYENELMDQYLMYLERKLSVDINADLLNAVKAE